MSTSGWLVTTDGKKRSGPYSDSQLKEMAEAGDLKPSHMVKRADAAKWHRADAIKGLFAPVAASAVPLAPARSSTARNSTDAGLRGRTVPLVPALAAGGVLLALLLASVVTVGVLLARGPEVRTVVAQQEAPRPTAPVPPTQPQEKERDKDKVVIIPPHKPTPTDKPQDRSRDKQPAPPQQPFGGDPDKLRFAALVQANADDPKGLEIIDWGERKDDRRTVKFRCAKVGVTPSLPGMGAVLPVKGGDPVSVDTAFLKYKGEVIVEAFVNKVYVMWNPPRK